MYDAKPGYTFCLVEMDINCLKEKSSGEIGYSSIKLAVRELTGKEEMILYPLAVDCGFLCSHEILNSSDDELGGSFELEGLNNDKSITIVYLIPEGASVKGIYLNGDRL